MTTPTVTPVLHTDEYNAALGSLRAEGIDPGRQEVETPFCYDRCLEKLSMIRPDVDLKHRVLQATDFVNNIILTKDGSLQEMELFIETEMFGYFDIPLGKNHPINKIFRSGYSETIKSKKKERTTKQKNAEREKTDTFEINADFEGLYQKTISNLGKVIIEPFYDRIAKYVSEKLHVIVFHGNVFCYGNGCYKVDTYTVKAEATRVLNGIMKNENIRDISKRLSDLMTYIENCNVVNEYPFNNHDNAFPVKNGVVVFDFEKGTQHLEENPDPNIWKFDYVLDVDCNSQADSIYVLKTLKMYLFDNPDREDVPDETKGRYDHRIILQMAAQGILQAMGYGPYKSVYINVGPQDSGKTTVIDILAWFVGNDCKCTIGLDEFTSGDRFVMAAKEGKILNLHDDLKYFKMGETGTLKAQSGGYNHKIERKGKDRYDGRITTVDIFTANHPAGFNRNIYMDASFWGRWYYIEYPNHFDQNDEFKKTMFTKENKSAFLNEVIKMMLEIRQAKE